MMASAQLLAAFGFRTGKRKMQSHASQKFARDGLVSLCHRVATRRLRWRSIINVDTSHLKLTECDPVLFQPSLIGFVATELKLTIVSLLFAA